MTPFQKSAITIAIDWLTTEPTDLSAWVAQGRLVRVMLEAALAEPGSALQVDAERYRWIADNAMAIDFVADPDNMVQIWHGTDPARFSAGKTLDEAVDAARRKT